MNFKEENKRLIEQYPFLLPHHRVTDEVPPNYDYEYTELDQVPNGWRNIALDLCKELKEELDKNNLTEKYRISQIKEKYGVLRWYDFGNTKNGYKIISKHCYKTRKICIKCGKPAKFISTDWISPYCAVCADIQYMSIPDDAPFSTYFSDVEDFYNETEECEISNE